MAKVIAEIAQGYEGNPHQTLLLSKAAVQAQADAVKFQLVYADELATPDYQYYSLFQSLEMPISAWEKAVDIIRKAEKELLFDIFGNKSFEIAQELRANGFKLSTTEFYNDELLSTVLSSGKMIYLSVGGIPIEHIDEKLRRHGLKPSHPICLMYGFQAEPTPLSSNHLARLAEMRRRYAGFKFGFMDHSAGGESEDALILPLMALSTGVDVIEKHLSLDYLLQLEDYVSALDPGRFSNLVRMIRKFECVYGSSEMTLTSDEKIYSQKAGKVAVAAVDIAAGETLTAVNVSLKRIAKPESHIGLIKELATVTGRRLLGPLRANNPITAELLDLQKGNSTNA